MRSRLHPTVLPPLLALAAAVLFAACAGPAPHAPTVPAPAPDCADPVHLPGLHQVVTYAPGFVGGGVPEGEEGLRTLAAMGIKTVVSVDGGAPDAAAAEALGMRYVHLPIRYSGIDRERQLELAQVVANAGGPVYVHCHHGKHRSAGALGSALVMTGVLSPEQAVARMKVSGTGENYQGLWQVVRDARPLPANALVADLAAFPRVATVSGMVATMSEIDSVFENVTEVQKAGWQTPADHPDLVPHKETKRLASLFAQFQQDPESRVHPDAYQSLLTQALALSRALDAAVAAGDAAAAGTQFTALQKSCKECHKAFRDN